MRFPLFSATLFLCSLAAFNPRHLSADERQDDWYPRESTGFELVKATKPVLDNNGMISSTLKLKILDSDQGAERSSFLVNLEYCDLSLPLQCFYKIVRTIRLSGNKTGGSRITAGKTIEVRADLTDSYPFAYVYLRGGRDENTKKITLKINFRKLGKNKK